MVIKYKILFFPLVVFLSLLALGISFATEKNIGIIMTGEIPYYNEIHKTLIETLTAGGFGPGKVNIILQTPAPAVVPWSNAARKLVAYDMDVIVTYGTPATVAVLKETSKIPVVFTGVYEPEILDSKGKNLTGITSKVPVVTAIKHLKSISDFSKLGIIFNDTERDTLRQADEIKELEGQFNYKTVRFNIKKPDDAFKISGVDALFVTTSCVARQCSYNVSQVIRKEKIPAVSIMGIGEESGAIMILTPDPHEQGKVAAEMVMRILKGEPPSSIPVERPKKIDMIINLKEASAIGLKIPIDILTSATKVIK